MRYTNLLLTLTLTSDFYLYADDAKLFSFIKTMEYSATLQKDLDSLTQWMEIWLLRLNIGKCKAISYSRRCELTLLEVSRHICSLRLKGIPTYISPKVKGYTDIYVILTYTGTCRLGYLYQKSTFSGKC